MANVDQSAGNPDINQDQLNQAILNTNYGSYVAGGGNPNSYTIGPGMVFQSGPAGNAANPYAGLIGLAGSGSGGYAPYAVGNGKTRWDEFVQQMQLENQKLAQEKAFQEEQLAQQKALEEAKLAQEKALADQSTVTDFDKQLMGMKGPADPYGYLFASRGMAAPQGYAPTQMALPDAVSQQYKNQGVDLAQAQNQLVGSSGPSFINGYLGSMSPALQQGPMGFQNTPQFKDVAPGSQSQPGPPPPTSMGQDPSGGGRQSLPPTQPQPPHFAQGGTVPGYAPGNDVVPAMLSPGEGVLNPQTVQQMGGPGAVNALNSGVQMFADGGMVLPAAWIGQVQDWFGGQRPIGTPQPGNGPGFTPWADPNHSSGLPQPVITRPFGDMSSPPPSSSGAPVLSGGLSMPPPPPVGPPMNLNMLDPYTRSMVDEYGRPQIPSAQALADMPSSGQQGYQNYVEKVAGGNYQDLLDQSKMMAPQGANPSDFKFS